LTDGPLTEGKEQEVDPEVGENPPQAPFLALVFCEPPTETRTAVSQEGLVRVWGVASVVKKVLALTPLKSLVIELPLAGTLEK
jgi:hypothetical protein